MRGVITKKPNGEDSETVDLSNLRKAGFFVIAELLTHRHGERSHAKAEPGPDCQPKVRADDQELVVRDKKAGCSLRDSEPTHSIKKPHQRLS